jgi:glutamine amidotransferase
MCEIYGFSGNREKELNTDLREFYSHANEHPNGWGLALLGRQETQIIRETNRADQSEYLHELLSESIVAKTALAHIRLATIGNVEYENCHPFVGTDNSGRSWALIHNGTVLRTTG